MTKAQLSDVPIATPRIVRLTVEQIGIPLRSMPINAPMRHPPSEPNRNGRGAPRVLRITPQKRQSAMVDTCCFNRNP